tara:strand:+ start:5987 stop:6181 length:195 start_codon:yes stop_codon:yes gene_type:complete
MKDMELLNTLDLKIQEMVATLERERQKKEVSNKSIHESEKLSKIEESIVNIMTLIDQFEENQNV